MPGPQTLAPASAKSPLERALSLFAEVRAGEGATAVLMLVNIFILLICYSVIKTVREPLILLGGGAEVRSYTAAGQALLLMGFVPAFGWIASRVDRTRLLVGMTLFFVACVELFSAAVAARVPYVGVAFFIWVGIFNMSLVAQFWSFANDIYTKDAADRLFPIIVVGMTAGAPIGSLIAARLFHRGIHPQAILQISALLLATSAALYLWINRRVARRSAAAPPIAASGGFQLVLRNPYLRLVAALIVLLNVVNTTGEYLISRLLSLHVQQLAALDPTFDRQAYIGAFAGSYQFWVNVTAFVLQAFVASRLVKYRGLTGVLLALPLIALGGYAIVAAGAGMGLVRWIKTAENATDYSIMNTARQLLWVPTTREEKYKAKQAIDTFFVRSGDVLSAAMVFAGASVLHLTVPQFARLNVVFTLAWIALAVRIARPHWALPAIDTRRIAAAATAVVIMLATAAPAFAQETREEALAAARADKATHLHEYEPTPIERRIMLAEKFFNAERPVYTFFGSVMSGGGFAVGPGYRGRFGDSGWFDTHAAWSIRNYKTLDANVRLPDLLGSRLTIAARGNWIDAPCGRRRRGHAGDRGDRRQPDLSRQSPLCGVRLALVAVVHAARRVLSRRLVGLSRHQVGRRRELPAHRRGSEPVPADPSRELDRRAARCRVNDRDRSRQRGAVLHAAGPGGQPYAARLSDVALPRSQPAGTHWRIPLDGGAVCRHGALR
jgi:ATP:ADP antiporter, AAA family